MDKGSLAAQLDVYLKKVAELRSLATHAKSSDTQLEFSKLAALYERMVEDCRAHLARGTPLEPVVIAAGSPPDRSA
jgi:hypothetical protein